MAASMSFITTSDRDITSVERARPHFSRDTIRHSGTAPLSQRGLRAPMRRSPPEPFYYVPSSRSKTPPKFYVFLKIRVENPPPLDYI